MFNMGLALRSLNKLSAAPGAFEGAVEIDKQIGRRELEHRGVLEHVRHERQTAPAPAEAFEWLRKVHCDAARAPVAPTATATRTPTRRAATPRTSALPAISTPTGTNTPAGL
jgi:hypothetical protein